MKTTFNLSKFNKQAFYDDGKGLMQKQTRSMMNCYKAKMDKGMSAQEAHQSCTDEYQKAAEGDWATKYANKKATIKLSKSQWEEAGKKAGWLKVAQDVPNGLEDFNNTFQQQQQQQTSPQAGMQKLISDVQSIKGQKVNIILERFTMIISRFLDSYQASTNTRESMNKWTSYANNELKTQISKTAGEQQSQVIGAFLDKFIESVPKMVTA